MNNFVYIECDWDWKCIDVFLSVEESIYHIEGYEEDKWKEANEFADRFAKS
jgi:hypothetical protein